MIIFEAGWQQQAAGGSQADLHNFNWIFSLVIG